MYRFGAILLAASLFMGCSDKATETAEKVTPADAGETAEPADKGAATESATATEPVVKPTPAEAAKSAFDALQAEYKKSEAAFRKKVQTAPRDEQMALFMSGGEKKEFAVKYLDLAKEYADTDTAFPAVKFAAENGDVEVSTEAFEMIVDKFGDDQQLVGMLRSFDRTAQLPEQKHEDFLKNLADNSTNQSVKGNASFALFQLLQRTGEMKEALADQPEMAGSIPEEARNYILMDRGNDLDEELQTMLTNVAKNFADIEFGGKTLGELAEEELFVFKYLSVGKVAPDIEGKDLDDEPFKLSDYRGKVVMLDFWGDW